MGEVVGSDQRNSFFIALKFSGEGGGQDDISHHVRGTCVGTLE